MKRDGVLVVGSANIDMVVSVKKFPQPGETIFGKKFQMFPGGKGANQAVCCARLGAKTYFIGKMGNDDFEKNLLKNFNEQGVDVSYMLNDDKESTGTALITVDENGENEIIVISGSNMKLSPKDLWTNKDIFENVKVVVSQLEIPLNTVEEVAKLAKENNNVFILNPAPAQKLSEELLSMIDYLTPNETELQLLSGININNEESIEKAVKILLNKGVRNIIVTLGEKGASLFNKKLEKKFSAPKVKVVDSTGAGDAFNGALAYALSNNEEIEKAVQFAVSVASFSVTKMGAQSSLPAIEELKYYKKAN